MTIMLGLIMLGLILAAFLLGFSQVNENLKNIERLLHNEIERQHEERLAQGGRDRPGRFLTERKADTEA